VRRPRIPGVGERQPPAPRVFISYRREDTAAYAGRLYDALAARFGDANVFMDVDTIVLGSDFGEAIDRALASCDAAIALIGRGWASARDGEGRRRLDDPEDVLRLELERALARGLVVIPALVQGAGLPGREDLPGSIVPLVQRQGIELRDDAWRDDVDRLARQLERLAGGAGEEDSTPTRRRSRGRWRWLAIAAVAAAGLAVGLALVLGDGDGGGNATSAGEDRLLAVIPSALHPQCQPSEGGVESAEANESCDAAQILTADYHLFEDQRVLESWYQGKRVAADVDTDSGSCDVETFGGEGPYDVGGNEVGRSFCFVDEDNIPYLVWTDTRATVGAEASTYESGPQKPQRLLEVWECCLQLDP
jgi:hypothetical protein